MASHSLGSRLKAQRESRGFTLAQIATSTKIPLTLLEALEREDLSRWPKGLYRRAFFRSYVAALGLPTEPLVLEFARLFPDDAAPTGVTDELAVASPEGGDPEHALALSWAGPSPGRRTLRTAVIAVAEVAGVAAVGSAIAWSGGLQFLETIGAVALVYLPVVRMTAGQGPRWQFTPSRRSAEAGGTVLDRWQPVAAQFAAAGSTISPMARRTGQVLKAGAATTGRVSRRVGKLTAGVSSRAFDATSHAFWKAVRSAAEHAELLASRQLKRTE